MILIIILFVNIGSAISGSRGFHFDIPSGSAEKGTQTKGSRQC